MNTTIFISITLVFVALTLLLGYFGYKHTRDNEHFLINTEKNNPLIIALSYGATFLSASAVVGFGGQAAKYGLSMVWLVFFNLFFGLAVAFIFFGRRTRRLGRKEKAFTFSDFLGKRFKSPMIRTFSAVIVMVGMPIYCAAVMLGGVNFIEAVVGLNKDVVLIGFAIIVAIYVTYGGIIAVMYNDALQAAIMFVGMAVILVFTYYTLGGVIEANTALTGLWDTVRNGGGANADALVPLADKGMNGWTAFSSFGSEVWLTVVTTFMLGVGIGAISQPQLAVRFMSAKDDRSLNRSLIIGSIFMLVIVGSAYTVGPLSNVFFFERFGEISIVYESNPDMIIPTYVRELFSGVAFGDVFVSLFVLAVLSASISTMAALLHTMGASGGYDIWSQVEERKGNKNPGMSMRPNRIMTLIMTVVVVLLAYMMPGNIIAKATAVFMGLTAATLLPSYAYSLYSERPNLNGAKASIIAGSISWAFWAFFVNKGISSVIGLSRALFGTDSLMGGLWPFVDPLIISLPISIAALMIGCLVWPSSKGDAVEAETVTES
jgi:SSS family solute:Na+ symporter